MDKSYQIIERRSRVRVRSALRGAAFMTVVAIAATWLGWLPKLAWGVVAFFLFVAAFEFVTTWIGRRREARTTEQPKVTATSLRPGEFGEYHWRGEEEPFFGTVISIRGRNVFVDLDRDQHEAQRIEIAKQLVSRADELAATFDAFKEAEAAKRPDCADEIRALELDLLSFVEGDPELASVSFSYESSGGLWSCSFRNFSFFDLTEEN